MLGLLVKRPFVLDNGIKKYICIRSVYLNKIISKLLKI